MNAFDIYCLVLSLYIFVSTTWMLLGFDKREGGDGGLVILYVPVAAFVAIVGGIILWASGVDAETVIKGLSQKEDVDWRAFFSIWSVWAHVATVFVAALYNLFVTGFGMSCYWKNNNRETLSDAENRRLGFAGQAFLLLIICPPILRLLSAAGF